MANLAQPEPYSVLSGWKEIATHLDRGVRTVQRYEHDFGLPVRRPVGHSHGSVIAVKSELDRWVYAKQVKSRSPALGEFRENLKNMKQLREEIRAVRTELCTSIATLRATVHLSSGVRACH